MRNVDIPVKDEKEFDFNANLLTSYADVLLGNLQRMEDTKPDNNTDASTARQVGNKTILIGFIFKYLIGCETHEEALEYYKKHKKEVNERYLVDRIVRRITFSEGINLSASQRLHYVLYLYYCKEWNREYILTKILKKGSRS